MFLFSINGLNSSFFVNDPVNRIPGIGWNCPGPMQREIAQLRLSGRPIAQILPTESPVPSPSSAQRLFVKAEMHGSITFFFYHKNITTMI